MKTQGSSPYSQVPPPDPILSQTFLCYLLCYSQGICFVGEHILF